MDDEKVIWDTVKNDRLAEQRLKSVAREPHLGLLLVYTNKNSCLVLGPYHFLQLLGTILLDCSILFKSEKNVVNEHR